MIKYMILFPKKYLYSNGKGEQQIISRAVGEALLDAIMAYDKKNYTQATDLLNSIKYKIIKVGGSNAQVSSCLIKNRFYNSEIVLMPMFFLISRETYLIFFY